MILMVFTLEIIVMCGGTFLKHGIQLLSKIEPQYLKPGERFTKRYISPF